MRDLSRLLLTGAALIAALIVPAPLGASGGEARCDGERVTVTEDQFGGAIGSGKDHIDGTNGDDVIHGAGGTDRVDALGGDDLVCGGGGADRIEGDTGHDIVIGNGGDDRGPEEGPRLVGGPGDDSIYGGGGDDLLRGNGGDDEHFGEEGDDRHDGGAGNDRCSGGKGADTATSCEQASGI